jgi:hypothetical protein
MNKLIGVLRKNNVIATLSQDTAGIYHLTEQVFSENIHSDFIMGPVWKYTNPDRISKYKLTRTQNHNILVADLGEDDINIIEEIIEADGFLCFLTASPRELINYQPVDAEPIGFYSDDNICEYAMEIITQHQPEIKTDIKPITEQDIFEMAEEIKRIEENLKQLSAGTE